MIKNFKNVKRSIPLLLILKVIYPTVAHTAVVPPHLTLAERQELVRNNGTEVSSLDPHKIEGVPEANISRDLFEGLVIIDPLGKVKPGLAASWETQDSQVWIFHLRPNAKWSNGEPITAHDVVYSWQRLANPDTLSPYVSYLQYAQLANIDAIIKGEQSPEQLGVMALDDHTLKITLSNPLPYLPKLLNHAAVSVVNRGAIEKFGDKWTQPDNLVSSGAYRLKDWRVNEYIILERNPFYWDNAATVIDRVTFLPISSETTELNRYRAGEIDLTETIPINLYSKLKQEIPAELKTTVSLCNYYYELNHSKPPLNDVRVRTALKLALDQDIIMNKVKQQPDIPAYSYTPPYTDGIELAKPEWFTWPQQKRNEEARRLLAAAGYDKNNPLTLTLLYNTLESHKKIAIAVASLWKTNLGVNIQLLNQEWKTFLDTKRQGNYDIARAGWCADYNEPSGFLNVFLSYSSNNTARYHSETFDNLLAATLKTASEEERAKLYGAAEKVMDEDSVIIPVYYRAASRLVKPKIGGYSTENPLDMTYTKDLYIIK